MAPDQKPAAVFTPKLPKADVLLKTDKTTLALERIDGGKIRVNTASWEAPKVLLGDQVLEIRSVHGQIRVAVKERHFDAADAPVKPYDPYELSEAKGDVTDNGEENTGE